ncbi:MAG: transposase [Phaeodactylibacter sp.]|nr:transposase [Phaeodactylibacter sp.]
MHPNATIGFLDGSSLQNRPNKCRLVNTPNKVYQPPKGKRTQPLFGFMSTNGNSCIKAIEKAIADQLIEFLFLIRAFNNDDNAIGIVLDNASIHHSKAVLQAAISLNIHFIFLPPYAPKYNPIEFLWKDGKRVLAQYNDFEEAKLNSERVFLELMQDRALSYSSSWRAKFLSS